MALGTPGGAAEEESRSWRANHGAAVGANRGLPCHWKRAGAPRQALHLVGRADAEDGEAVSQHLAHGEDQCEPGVANRLVVDEKSLGIIVTVKFLRQILEVERQLMRSEIARGSSDATRACAY